MTTPTEDEARAEAERIEQETYDRWEAGGNGPAGLAKELVVAGAMWAASRVSTPPSEDWEYSAALASDPGVAFPMKDRETAEWHVNGWNQSRRRTLAREGRDIGESILVRRPKPAWEPVPTEGEA